MLQRVTNPNNTNFHHYGGRGITVCVAWKEFAQFYADMGACPAGYTLERVDNAGNYEKSNCVWAARTSQARNTRRTSHENVGISETAAGTFEVRIRVDGRRHHIGTFTSWEDARDARRAAEIKHWGHL